MREKLGALQATRPTMWALAVAVLLLMPAQAASDERGARHESAGSSWQGQRPAGWSAGAVARGTGFSRLGGSARVREVQRKLNRLGYGAGKVDGLFGPITDGAVRRFQRGNALSTDGVVGPRTLGKLRSHSKRLERLLAMGVGFSKPGGSTRVRQVQRKLNRLGYGAGKVDGLFGPITDGAVRRFQSRRRLAVDGIVGPKTSRRLRVDTGPRRRTEVTPRKKPKDPTRQPAVQRSRDVDPRGARRFPWQGQPLLAQWATVVVWVLNALMIAGVVVLLASRVSSASRATPSPPRRREGQERPGQVRPGAVAPDGDGAAAKKVPSPPPIERLGARLSLSHRQRTGGSVDTFDVELRLFVESAERHWEADVPDPRLTAVAVGAEDIHERIRKLVVPERLPTVAAALNDQGINVRSHYLEEVSFVIELTREVERELLKRGWT
jgi:peptidoglycan hydrolase-like protein with peptidoglycan-binding domain